MIQGVEEVLIKVLLPIHERRSRQVRLRSRAGEKQETGRPTRVVHQCDGHSEVCFRDTPKGKINGRVANGVAVVVLEQHENVCKVEVHSIGFSVGQRARTSGWTGPRQTIRWRIW